MNNPWQSLEEVRDLWSPGATWRHHLGPSFDAFSAGGFLQRTGSQTNWIHCENKSGCWYEMSLRGRNFTLECKGDDGTGKHSLPLPEDLGIWAFDLSRLGRDIAWAFGFEAVELRLPPPRTFRLGSFSDPAVAVVLTVPQNRDEFQQVITLLTAEAENPFILFGPTNRFFDSRCKELLEKRQAGFFDLASHVDITADGKLVARRPARELFVRFLKLPTFKPPLPPSIEEKRNENAPPSVDVSHHAILKDIHREVVTGRAENRDGFEKTRRGIGAVAREQKKLVAMGPSTTHEAPVSDSEAERLFALIEKLESGGRLKPPSVMDVFRLYCIKGKTTDQIVDACHCSKGTVINRLDAIRRATGKEPNELRAFSPYMQKIEESITDSRAEHIHRKALVHDNEENENESE